MVTVWLFRNAFYYFRIGARGERIFTLNGEILGNNMTILGCRYSNIDLPVKNSFSFRPRELLRESFTSTFIYDAATACKFMVLPLANGLVTNGSK